MDKKKDFIENILGGLFALVAIFAAVVEMLINGMTVETIVSCIKDVFGTLAIVVLLLALIKDAIPKRSFEQKLKAALNNWIADNNNMIVRVPKNDIESKDKSNPPTCFSMDLKTDVVDFYDPNGVTVNTGLFLRMPLLTRENYAVEGVRLTFYLNKGTFFSHKPSDVDLSDDYSKLIGLFSGLLNNKHAEYITAGGKGREIYVVFKKPIKTNSDIHELVDIINTMYTAYLVSANLNKS